jgi:hypothetical protein
MKVLKYIFMVSLLVPNFGKCTVFKFINLTPETLKIRAHLHLCSKTLYGIVDPCKEISLRDKGFCTIDDLRAEDPNNSSRRLAQFNGQVSGSDDVIFIITPTSVAGKYPYEFSIARHEPEAYQERICPYISKAIAIGKQ